MPDHEDAYRTRGWTGFAPESCVEEWALAVAPVAEDLSVDPAHKHRWRCGGTWFTGTNTLPNDENGALPKREVPPLTGEAVEFARALYGDFAFDKAQLSIVTSGYPAKGEEESEAALRYRVKRCAAHVDGPELIMPGRRRKICETHGFVLGLPLSNATVDHAPFVVWEGSHEVMRAAFRGALDGHDPDVWRALDITDAYVAARMTVFETCRTVELAPGLGAAYVIHPLALHGVAPWRGGPGPSRAVAYFRPDTFGGDPVRWLEA